MLDVPPNIMFKIGCLSGLIATILGARGGHKIEWK
jgi:hypothetical protein